MNIETRPGIIHYTGLTSTSEVIHTCCLCGKPMKKVSDTSFECECGVIKFTGKEVIGKSFKKEAVNHPDHYGGEDDPYEAIKVIEAWNLDFCLGNVVKYISRAGKKDDIIQDLEKARWYLDREIQTLRNTILK